MRDILPELRAWLGSSSPLAIATVVAIDGSAPRPPGTTLAVDGAGEVIGSVSGGCVEGAVFERAVDVLGSGAPAIDTYGISDDDAFAVGLTCGGILTVLVTPVGGPQRELLQAVTASIAAEEPVALATVTGGPAPLGARLALWADGRAAGSLGTEGLDAAVGDDARGLLSQGQTAERHYGPRGERREDAVTVFVDSYAPPPRMLVFGAIDFAAAVARTGAFLGYRVTVCDARPVFATRKRFPEAHEVVVDWPHRYLAGTAVDERTVICVLTHDPKFDVPLLEVALRTPAAYVGAMGSRRTHADRLARLREVGLTEPELARLRSPIGLDLGARTPQETAVSIAAEIIQQRWGGTGEPLSRTAGAIHQTPASPVDAAALAVP